MPVPALNVFDSDRRLPARVDVVVIGGGIVGVATALELSERGHSVLVCEKGQIGGEQSSRNWGWVRISQRDPRELPLMAASIREWEVMDQRTGHPTGYRKSGILFEAARARDIAANEQVAAQLSEHGIAAGILSADEVAQVLPGLSRPMNAALYTPEDGRAEPQWAAPAMAEAARAAGASVMTNCAVRSLDLEAGEVAGVITEKGRVKCSAVVLAGGAWSRLFAGNLGIDLPQLKVLNTVMRTTPVDGPEAALWSTDFAMRKRADGGYTVASGSEHVVDLVPDSFRLARRFLPAYAAQWRSLKFRLGKRWKEEAQYQRQWRPDEITPFEQCRTLDPEPSMRILRNSWAAVQQAFPAFAQADIVQSWAGMIDVTPDALPVISGVDTVPGLHIATGFSGHGFGIAPGAGRLMADLVTGREPLVDPGNFRLSRFSDGSKIELLGGF